MTTQVRERTIWTLAEEAWKQAAGSWEDANANLEERLVKDGTLYQDVLRSMAKHLAPMLLGHFLAAERAALRKKGPVPAGRPDSPDGLLGQVEDRIRSWLDYPLSSGVRLADATEDVITPEAEMREKRGRTYLVDARWLRRIAARLKEGQRTREVWGEEDLALLYEEVRREVE